MAEIQEERFEYCSIKSLTRPHIYRFTYGMLGLNSTMVAQYDGEFTAIDRNGTRDYLILNEHRGSLHRKVRLDKSLVRSVEALVTDLS